MDPLLGFRVQGLRLWLVSRMEERTPTVVCMQSLVIVTTWKFMGLTVVTP